jgi:hypothetical protein
LSPLKRGIGPSQQAFFHLTTRSKILSPKREIFCHL